MKQSLIPALSAAIALSACAASHELASEPSYTIHNPDIYGSAQPLVDDDGIPLALPAAQPAMQPAVWYLGTGRMVD